MKEPQTLKINKCFMRDGTTLLNLVLNEYATPLNGFIAVKAINEDGQESTNTVYINAAEVQGIEVSDEMQPFMYDFIRPTKIEVKEK